MLSVRRLLMDVNLAFTCSEVLLRLLKPRPTTSTTTES